MKKNLLLLLISLSAAALATAQIEVNTGYVYGQTNGIMRTTIPAIHSVQMEGFYNFPGSNFAVGMEIGGGSYGTEKSERHYGFDNGTSMLAPVTVSNNIFNGGLMLRYDLIKDVALVPYAIGKAGFSRFGTRLSVEDPRAEHTDECPVPLVSESLHSDYSFTTAVGGGVRYDMGNLFKFLGSETIFLDFNATFVRGSVVEYMSVNAPGPGSVGNGEVRDVDFQFANAARPEVIHEYHTGYLYRTPMELVNYRFAVVYRLP